MSMKTDCSNADASCARSRLEFLYICLLYKLLKLANNRTILGTFCRFCIFVVRRTGES